jgi:hypothetical protein
MQVLDGAYGLLSEFLRSEETADFPNKALPVIPKHGRPPGQPTGWLNPAEESCELLQHCYSSSGVLLHRQQSFDAARPPSSALDPSGEEMVRALKCTTHSAAIILIRQTWRPMTCAHGSHAKKALRAAGFRLLDSAHNGQREIPLDERSG